MSVQSPLLLKPDVRTNIENSLALEDRLHLVCAHEEAQTFVLEEKVGLDRRFASKRGDSDWYVRFPIQRSASYARTLPES